MQSPVTQITYSTFDSCNNTVSNTSSDLKNSNFCNSMADILKAHTIPEVLFSLYCQLAQQLEKNPHNQKNKEILEKQLEILDVACGMIEDSVEDDDFYLIY